MAKIWIKNPTRDDPDGQWIESGSAEGQAYNASKGAVGSAAPYVSPAGRNQAALGGTRTLASTQQAALLGRAGVSPVAGAGGQLGGSAPAVGALPGGTTGAGSGGGAGTSQYAQAQTQQNPYIVQLMKQQQGLFDKPFDREKERAMTRREQSQSLNEARQLAAGQGRGGMWGSQQQQIVNNQQQALAGQEAGFSDRETAARLGVLNAGVGIGGESTRDIAMQLAAVQQLNELNQRSDLARQDLQFKYDDLAVRAQQQRASSVLDLLRYL